jgi:hypothetical protein
VEPSVARELWVRLETLHAVTYFGEETQAAARANGLDGFWIGYFALRAAPLGPVSPAVVEATFANFAPTFVRRWVPACWERTSPAAVLDARSAAAAATLRRVAPTVEDAAVAVNELLAGAATSAEPLGRPLFAANRDLARPDDPVAALWQACTTLREHRGDGHLAALASAGLSGLEAHVLITADRDGDPVDLQRTRGWTPSDWDGATDGLVARGLLEPDGALTPQGRTARATVEATTDQLAAAAFVRWSPADADDVLAALTPAAINVSASGVLRYPNPIGLPPLG